MAATNSSSKTTLDNIISDLKDAYPSISFTEGGTFAWNPKDHTVYFTMSSLGKQARWTLLHEFAHGMLDHQDYTSDLELLTLETAAWEAAKILQVRYDKTNPIDEDHIQDCLDTYRDWLYARSRCTHCEQTGLQMSADHYYCINCTQRWQVTHARFNRPYRTRLANKNLPPDYT